MVTEDRDRKEQEEVIDVEVTINMTSKKIKQTSNFSGI